MHSSKPPTHTLSQSGLALEAPLGEGLWASVEEAPGQEPQQEPADQLSLRYGCRCLVLGEGVRGKNRQHRDPPPTPAMGAGSDPAPPLQKARPQLGCSEGLKGQLW